MIPKFFGKGDGETDNIDRPWHSVLADIIANIRNDIADHDRELKDHDARLEELEVGQGLIKDKGSYALDDEELTYSGNVRDYQIDQPETNEGSVRVSTVDGAELWIAPNKGTEGMYFITSPHLRSEGFAGVAVTPSTLSDLATIAELEDEKRGGD